MAMTGTVEPRRQAIGLTVRALHRLDGMLPFPRHPMRGAGPLLSVTFDDIPASAADLGATVLERAGLRGTFYISTGLMGLAGADWHHADRGAVASLAGRGHEIGLHSHAHRPAAHLGRRSFARDLAGAGAALRAFLPKAPLDNFAYPFGFVDSRHRAFLSRTMRSSRTTHPGLNVGRVDPHRLLSHAVGERLRDEGDIGRLLDEAVAMRGWLILTLHDVDPRPSPYGCTPETLVRIVSGALDRGMAVCTMSEALDRCGFPAKAAA